MQLLISPRGLVHCVYDESFNLAALGRLRICRASHVEPDPQGRWTADLSPIGGPTLGPFTVRSEALSTERQWIERRWLNVE